MPSFGLALAMEGEGEMESHFAKLWINQMEKEVFDDMLFDIPRLYSLTVLSYMLSSLQISQIVLCHYILKDMTKVF
jgi:hypothetical protein